MWEKNNIIVGLGLGTLLPLLTFIVLYFGYNQLEAAGVVSEIGFSPMFRERTTSIIAICTNLIPLNIFQKRRATQSMRGIVLSTVVYVVIWVVYFGQYIMQQ